ncbi:MAG: LysE family translocator, partial [Pseudomonadota bacterium]
MICITLVIIPGPSVTIIVSNSLRAGVKAGLKTVLGTQIGVLAMIIILAFGFELVEQKLAIIFEFIRYIGILHLSYLGIKMLIQQSPDASSDKKMMMSDHFVLQGLAVVATNPKLIFFFGACIPQFIDQLQNIRIQFFIYAG